MSQQNHRLHLCQISWNSRMICVLAYVLAHVCYFSHVRGFVRIENSQKDELVVEGGRAMFLCIMTPHPLNYGKELPAKIHWTLAGRRLDLEVQLDGQSRYISKTNENRHVLVITKARADDEGEYACSVSVGDKTEKATRKLVVQRPPEPPIDVRVKSCHGNTAEISWQPGKSNGANILGYTVQFNLSDKPDIWYDSYEESPGDATQAFVSLSPYGTYSFRVTARNIVGSSRPSSTTSRECTTPPDRPDRNPSGVQTITDKKGFLVLEWEPLHRLSFHGPGFCYFVLWRRKGSLAWSTATVNGTYASRFEQEVDDIYGLYEFQVKSQNDMGEAHQPAFIYTGRSFESEPKITITGFRQDQRRPITQGTAHFVWEAIDSNDRQINGKFMGYKILYWKWDSEEKEKREVYIPLTGVPLDVGQEMKGSVSDLPAYSIIKVQVVVVNTHYQGPPSDTIDVFTPEGTPTAVQGLFADSVTHESVTLRWLPPERPNGILTGFVIGYQTGNRLGPLTTVQSHSNSPLRLQARIGDLKPNYRYRFHILAKTRAGRGERAYIDVRTGNKTAASVSTSSTTTRFDSDKLDFKNSASLHKTNVSLLSIAAVTLTWCFSYIVFHDKLKS